MALSDVEIKKLALASGNRCAFPSCTRRLVNKEDGRPEGTVIGEIAHIVGQSRQGPRGNCQLSETERDKAENLIYLCEEHHKIIDDKGNLRRFSVAVLQKMKLDHESKMLQLTGGIVSTPAPILVQETVHGTVLPVTKMPQYIYSAATPFKESQNRDASRLIDYSSLRKSDLAPFLLRDQRLYAFQDLRRPGNPFAQIADPASCIKIALKDFTADLDGRNRLVSLLNISLSKLCYRSQIYFDRDHHRYIFQTKRLGTERSEHYKALTGRSTTRNVVWNPKKRSSGEGRPFWYHLAAGLQFHHFGKNLWGMSIRPERHITLDGEKPYRPKSVGKIVTRLKARMFNNLYLGEVHFWRSFLSGGTPRIILSYDGTQSAIIDSKLLDVALEWPGIPDDTKAFTNTTYEDDLFSMADFDNASKEEDDWFDEDLGEGGENE